MKFRALRLYEGNFSWGSENITRKVLIYLFTYFISFYLISKGEDFGRQI